MALTTTTLNGTITAGVNQIVLTAFTNPSTGAIGAKTILRFTTGEVCLVTDATLSPTISVVRGYAGTLAEAHTTLEGIQYGLTSDAAWPNPVQEVLNTPVLNNAQISIQTQEITATGATGSTAATVTPAGMAFLSATGASGAGINLPVPAVGDVYIVRNNMTGALNIYSVGGSINGTTGTTAFPITATGTLGAMFACSTAGAWRVALGAT